MLTLTEATATLEHMNTYAEKAGDETVNAIALKISTTRPMAVLDQFAQGLVGALYQKEGLRFPSCGPLKWKRELVGASVTIDSEDLLGERCVEFKDAVVDKFQLEPLEGGSVNVTMRVKVKPDPDQVAVLYQLQHTEVLLTIDPAKAEEQHTDEREPDLATMGEDS